jgi:hypothetical protein
VQCSWSMPSNELVFWQSQVSHAVSSQPCSLNSAMPSQVSHAVSSQPCSLKPAMQSQVSHACLLMRCLTCTPGFTSGSPPAFPVAFLYIQLFWQSWTMHITQLCCHTCHNFLPPIIPAY